MINDLYDTTVYATYKYTQTAHILTCKTSYINDFRNGLTLHITRDGKYTSFRDSVRVSVNTSIKALKDRRN